MTATERLRAWRDGTAWHHRLVANGPLWWTCRDCRALHVPTCRCGHPADAHEHYRGGNDCGACAPRCLRYRRRRWWHRRTRR